MTSAAFKLGIVPTQGWFWMRRNGCTVLYRGASIAEIDFSRIVCVTGPQVQELSLPAHLSHAPGSTYCYLVRRFNGCGYQEHTTSAAVVVRIAPDGRLAGLAPNAVFGRSGEQVSANRLRLTWFYGPLEQEAAPEHFNIYWDNGTGQVNFESPIATVPYGKHKFYGYECDVPSEGQYTFVIKAEGAGHVESLPSPRLSLQINSGPPQAAEIVAAVAV